jgi:outer membrane immunogenic protein
MNRSRVFRISAAAVMMADAARAADLPIERNVYVETPAAIGMMNWTGIYVGANLGFSRAKGSIDLFDSSIGIADVSLSQRLSGAIGGVQIGGNWQTGNAVFGFEADIQGSGQSVSDSATFVVVTTNPDGSLAATSMTASHSDKITSFVTLRGRLGIATGRWLPYVTGGAAYGTWRSDFTVTGIGTANLSNNWYGGVIGGGLEAAVIDNWTIKAEFLYLESQMITSTPFPATAPNLHVNTRIHDNIFRVGVNYLFATGSVGCRPHLC